MTNTGRFLNLAALASMAVVGASAAEAHTGAGAASGIVHGFMHPVSGIDHVLAMLAVGLLAAVLGGRARWLVPLTFIGVMVIGGLLGMSGAQLPYAETGIAASVLVLGAVLMLSSQLPMALAMAITGFFAVFHGFAHGAEMPADASGLGYAAAFLSATAMLHGIGLLAGLSTARASRVAGGAIALAGVALLAGLT